MLHKECNSLAQRNEQLGMRDAGTQFLRGIADAFDRTEDVFHQFVHVAGATVGQFPFGQRPDPFIGVKLRCIRRKVLDPQATMLVQQLFDRCSFVCGGVIQHNDDRAAQVTQQFAQKHTDLILPDVVIEEQVVEADTMSPGA